MSEISLKLGKTRRMRARVAGALASALVFALIGLTFTVASASAQIEVEAFESGPIGSNAEQAGAHADLRTTFVTPASLTEELFGQQVQAETVKDLSVDLPPGFIGSTVATPTCPVANLTNNTCPVGSQIGTAEIIASGHFLETGETNSVTYGLYFLEPEPGHTAEIGFTIGGIGNTVGVISVGSGTGYALRATFKDVPSELLPLVFGTRLTFWGVPADPSHDAERVPFGGGFVPGGGVSTPSSSPLVPFLTNPTACGPSSGAALLRLDSYQSPGLYTSAFFDSPAINGCDRLQFHPALSLQPVEKVATQPSGYEVDLVVPQNEAPNALATPDVKSVAVQLPDGVSVSPPSADGLEGCSEGQVGLESGAAADCPSASKIGNVNIDTPLLEKPMQGSLFLAKERENPFGSLLAVYLVAEGQGVTVKLPGKIEAAAGDGQLTVTFDNTPQLPFEELKVDLQGGPRAPLSNPKSCGTYETGYTVTSWAGQTVSGSNPVTINQNCQAASQFNPSLEAGVTNPTAGATSTFALNLNRPDGQQNISTLSVTLPKGQLAKLAGVPLCPDAQAATGACDPSTQIGTTTVAVGPGTSPLYVPQPGKAATGVYLAGPYKGAPYSLVVKVPAQAGPFDLGTVAVRTALQVNPETTQVTAVSDPLPQILQGIPLTYQKVDVTIDRPGFIINPTNCEPTEVTSTITSAQGTQAHPSTRYQVANCASLGFAPKLAINLKGATKRAKDPALKAVLTSPEGQSNIGKVQVILPKSVFIDQSHVGNPCTRVQFNEGAGNGSACPAKSILGKATAYSPLLSEPLKGSVYFRSNGGERKLPDLVASLGGQIHVNLVGFIDSVHQKGTGGSRVRNTFASVPDAPVSRFVLELQGGKKGLLQNSANLCKTTNKATVKMDGQNGKDNDFETVVKPACGKKSKPKKK